MGSDSQFQACRLGIPQAFPSIIKPLPPAIWGLSCSGTVAAITAAANTSDEQRDLSQLTIMILCFCFEFVSWWYFEVLGFGCNSINLI